MAQSAAAGELPRPVALTLPRKGNLRRVHLPQLDALAALLPMNQDLPMRRATAVPENSEVVIQDVDDRPEFGGGGHALLGATHPERGDSRGKHLPPMLLSRPVVGMNPYAALRRQAIR